jgi:hypothetical protein
MGHGTHQEAKECARAGARRRPPRPRSPRLPRRSIQGRALRQHDHPPRRNKARGSYDGTTKAGGSCATASTGGATHAGDSKDNPLILDPLTLSRQTKRRSSTKLPSDFCEGRVDLFPEASLSSDGAAVRRSPDQLPPAAVGEVNS